MKALTVLLATSFLALSPIFPAQAQTTAAGGEHVTITPQGITWEAGPDSLPRGVEYDVLYGDPAKEGQFVMRLKMPAGYYIPPHTHPMLESVTVLSGTFRLGQGETAARDTADILPAGSYFGMPPGMVHYAFTDEETIVQLNGLGPWEINYINPADDPRRQSRYGSLLP